MKRLSRTIGTLAAVAACIQLLGVAAHAASSQRPAPPQGRPPVQFGTPSPKVVRPTASWPDLDVVGGPGYAGTVLNFGSAIVGGETLTALELRNRGRVALAVNVLQVAPVGPFRVSSIALSPGGAQAPAAVAAAPFTVRPGGFARVTLAFAPAQAADVCSRERAATRYRLSVLTDDPDERIVDIRLCGTGLEGIPRP